VDGKTGYIVDSLSEMIKKVDEIPKIKREDCREHVAKHFNAQRMAKEHLLMYQKVIKLHQEKLLNQAG